ncbi:oxidoreductase [Pseudomonas mandelii]|uniref:oxidoreductase n=1 Tax=Pseudomonas mandelii TaxID=75612 RepID=UPI00209D43ED|nr:oxidoreductase [Pseudomonas mandelii]MCO8310954.1 oxidoreductase [Pseudomonas mandelii]
MRTWFITGASRGLGREIARAALKGGDQVVATARNPEWIKSGLPGFGDRLLALALDVTNQDAIEAAVDKAVKHFGRIDVLINNAGYGQLGAFEELSVSAIEKQFATNLFGVFAVTRAVLPVMRSQRAGHILTVSSTAGIIGFDGASIYCATKFALEGWSESLSLELAQFGIRTTVVEPGGFRTDFLDSSSVAYSDISIPDYAAYSSKRKDALDEYNHNQGGDPVKFGKTITILVATQEPPVRFAVGSDAYGVVSNKANILRAEANRWRGLSITTDIAVEQQSGG